MEELSFDQAITRLEEVVRQMESGDLPLEETMRLFEEGARLTAVCSKKLEQAEQKVVSLSTLQPETSNQEGSETDSDNTL